MNPVLLTKLAEEYCQAYADDAEIDHYPVKELLNKCSLCILPLVNPDGYETVLQVLNSIRNPILRQLCKMRGIGAEHWKYNARGVDINRNFPCKSYIQQQLGEYPASENETRALMKVFEEYETVGYIDFHSRGRIIYYYRQAMPFSYNQRNHKLARYMQKLSDYSIGKREEEYMSRLNGDISGKLLFGTFAKTGDHCGDGGRDGRFSVGSVLSGENISGNSYPSAGNY